MNGIYGLAFSLSLLGIVMGMGLFSVLVSKIIENAFEKSNIERQASTTELRKAGFLGIAFGLVVSVYVYYLIGTL